MEEKRLAKAQEGLYNLFVAIYAGAWPGGNVFKSRNGGQIWGNTADFPNASVVVSRLQASDGAICSNKVFAFELR